MSSGIMVPMEELREESKLVRGLAAENESLRQTNARLNRRCQRAEKVARWRIERCRRAGVSLSRAMALWALEDMRRRVLEIVERKTT